MTLLVTDGACYIGPAVSQRLIEERRAVAVLNDLSKGHLDAVPDEALCARSHSNAAGVCAGARLDAVVHLAASSIVEESVRHLHPYVDNDVTGTARVVRVAAAERANRVLGWCPRRAELTTIVADAR
jgi:UDP-glucose 4-epimerase